MADNLAITAGTGTNIATDQLAGGEHVQFVKIMDGTLNGETKAAVSASGLKVDLGADNDVTVTSGAITETNSGTIAGDTTSIDGKITACDTGAVVISSGTVTANLSATDNAVLDNIDSNTDYGAVVGGGAEATALRVTIANDSTGVVSVDDNGSTLSIDDGGGAITVDGTVTANLSATDNTVLDNIDTNTTGLAGTVSGSELQVDVVASLPAGTNAIGKLAANSGVDIGDVDVTSLPDGAQDTNYFTATITSADASSATTVKAKTAAKKIYVTSLMISVGATALEVQLQSDNGTPQVVMEEVFLAANGGFTMSSADKTVPLFVVNTNEDLDVITSGAGDVTVLVSGFVA